MNDLPYAFYESVFRVSWTTRDFVTPLLSITAKELPGNIGFVAQQMTSMYKHHAVAIRNNQITGEECSDLNNEVFKHFWIEKNKFVGSVTIYFYTNNEEKVSKEIIDRIFFPNAVYFLALKTATVSKTWIDWACTAKRLTGLCIHEKLDDESIALCKRLIEAGSLTQLYIENEAYSEGAMEMMKTSLIQPQFQSLRLTENGDLEELLAFWSQNREALRGKDLFLETLNHVQFLEGKLELCPQEEFDPIGRHHFYFPFSLFCQPSRPYKLKYGRDEEGSHGAYVFFTCFERNPNESEMSCFAKMPEIGILFT